MCRWHARRTQGGGTNCFRHTIINHRTLNAPPIPRHSAHSAAGLRRRLLPEPIRCRPPLSQGAGHPFLPLPRPRQRTRPSCRLQQGKALPTRSRTGRWRTVARPKSRQTCTVGNGKQGLIRRPHLAHCLAAVGLQLLGLLTGSLAAPLLQRGKMQEQGGRAGAQLGDQVNQGYFRIRVRAWRVSHSAVALAPVASARRAINTHYGRRRSFRGRALSTSSLCPSRMSGASFLRRLFKGVASCSAVRPSPDFVKWVVALAPPAPAREPILVQQEGGPHCGPNGRAGVRDADLGPRRYRLHGDDAVGGGRGGVEVGGQHGRGRVECGVGAAGVVEEVEETDEGSRGHVLAWEKE